MARTARRPPQLRGRVFRGSRAVARGILTRGELRSRAWRPVFRDVYADAQLTISHRTRCLAAARWVLPPGAVIAGRSAAALFGAGLIGDAEPLDILVPSGLRFGPVAGLVVHTGEVAEADVLSLSGIPVTTPLRTCWDLARWLDPEEAVVVVDRLLGQRLVRADELREMADRRRGARGWKRMLRVAQLADPGEESRLRVRIVLAGVRRPVTQFVVERDGRFIARVDLAWPELKIAVEYDGLWHDDPRQLHRDRRRLNRLLGEDWIVLHVTAQRLREDFEGFLAELRQALRTRTR
ncbi:hypothetical protein [Micromonospora andamanensis]|uniref:hypothetical protein n=1 Tax=Micromonospora andamanensis TaxID=1287068 RepID=UPI001950C226|nr:hypothetical protein [Micromonospora andamanensis]